MQPPSAPHASPTPASREVAPLDLSPHILVVDDERPVHSSLRLRLGPCCHLVCVFEAQEALQHIRQQEFDLCIVDIHMPKLDGLSFVEAARELDPGLGYVILSGYDSPENLRRAIPLQVLDFIGKPIPQKSGFEERVAEWVDRTRARRREINLARSASNLIQDLDLVRIEKDVEATASAFAREALLQSAGLLTTIQALLLNAHHLLNSRGSADPRTHPLARSIAEARKHADTAATVAERFFTSAYAERQTSPALVDDCIQHAIAISLRAADAEARRQRVDFRPLGRATTLSDLAGIDFILMLVPTIVQALEIAEPDGTVAVECANMPRLDAVLSEPTARQYLWVNRSHAATSHAGVMISIRAPAPAPLPADARSWLHGETRGRLRLPCRGLIRGVQQAKGLAGVAIQPEANRFAVVLCLRV